MDTIYLAPRRLQSREYTGPVEFEREPESESRGMTHEGITIQL